VLSLRKNVCWQLARIEKSKICGVELFFLACVYWIKLRFIYICLFTSLIKCVPRSSY